MDLRTSIECHFEWPWMILSDLAKYSTTLSTDRAVSLRQLSFLLKTDVTLFLNSESDCEGRDWTDDNSWTQNVTERGEGIIPSSDVVSVLMTDADVLWRFQSSVDEDDADDDDQDGSHRQQSAETD